MQQVNLAEAKNRLPDLIEIAIKGEEVIIFNDDQRGVQLVPTQLPKDNPKCHPQFGSAKGLIFIADDFDTPLEDFKEYMS